MKSKDIKALHSKDMPELRKMLKEVQTYLADARLEQSMYKLKNTRSLFTKRKEMAVIKTIMKEKEMEHDKNI